MSEMNALQTLIYNRLTTCAPLVALVGQRVYDRPPLDAPNPYVSFGPSDVTIDDYDCINGRIETMQIDCWSTAEDGMRECKDIVDAVKKALHQWTADPLEGALVDLQVVLVRVFLDRDGITTHGVVQVEATMEEDD